MKRSEFLKRLGMVAVAIPLAPKIAAEAAELLDMGKEGDFEYPPMRDIIGEDLAAAMEKPEIFDEMRDIYGHYEQDWIYNTKPWPLQMWDVIITTEEKSYVVTEVRYGSVVLTPHDARDKIIIAHNGDEMLRIPNAANFNT